MRLAFKLASELNNHRERFEKIQGKIDQTKDLTDCEKVHLENKLELSMIPENRWEMTNWLNLRTEHVIESWKLNDICLSKMSAHRNHWDMPLKKIEFDDLSNLIIKKSVNLKVY